MLCVLESRCCSWVHCFLKYSFCASELGIDELLEDLLYEKTPCSIFLFVFIEEAGLIKL